MEPAFPPRSQTPLELAIQASSRERTALCRADAVLVIPSVPNGVHAVHAGFRALRADEVAQKADARITPRPGLVPRATTAWKMMAARTIMIYYDDLTRRRRARPSFI